MRRPTGIEFIGDLMEEFDLNPNQKISTLLQCLEDDGSDDDAEDDDVDEDDEENEDEDDDENGD